MAGKARAIAGDGGRRREKHGRSYLSNEGSYQKTEKGVPPLIYHAESNYALEKWKGRLPSYLGNEGSYQKTVKGVPPIIYHAESNYALKKWKGRLSSYLGNEGSYQKTKKAYHP